MLTFNPDALLTQITQTNRIIHDIKKEVETNEMLSPLRKPLEEMQDYVSRTEIVTNVYSDIYLQIIKPIQMASQAGVRATAKWAIISIVLATTISIIVTNWNSVFHLLEEMSKKIIIK
ncbi:MAG TPA: hypothetical protein ACFYD3_00990 [Candidatus Hypogeohydataceae bacterium YC41]